MIEVKLTLYTPWEMAVITEGMGIIQKAREAQVAPLGAEIVRPPADTAEPPKEATPYQIAVAEAIADTIAEHGPNLQKLAEATKVIDHIAPKGPSLADVEAAAHAHILKHGLPATRALVESYGGNQIKKVDEAKWPAMLAQLKTEVGE